MILNIPRSVKVIKDLKKYWINRHEHMKESICKKDMQTGSDLQDWSTLEVGSDAY